MKNIYLIGFMGCGKTTVGKLLSEELNCAFVDTDTAISKKHLRTVESLFATHGETWFRTQEYRLLQKFQSRDNYVIATGGGMAIEPRNWQLLQQHITVFLDIPFETLWNKIQSTRRPLVRRGEEALRQLWQQRFPYYCQANYRIVYPTYDPPFFCKQIIQFIQNQTNSH